MSDYLDTENTSLLEGSVAEARRLADALAAHAAGLRGTPRPSEALDEVFRAAHSLRAEAEAAGMAGVAEIAGLIREAAEAMRGGEAAEGPAVLLAEAARAAARAAQGGDADTSAAHALLAELRGRAAPSTGLPPGRRLLRVQPSRLEALGRAAAEAERSAAALSAGAQSPGTLLGEARGAASRFHDVMTAAARELPGILDSVRSGAAATDAARAVMESFAAAEGLVSRMEDGLAAAARQVTDAAAACAGAAREVREAAARARLVPLGPLFRSVSRALGPRAAVEVTGQDVEIDSSLVDAVRASLVCLAASRLPERARRRAPAKLSLGGRRQDDWVTLTLSGGRSLRTRSVAAAAVEAAERLARVGGTVAGASVMEVRVPALPGLLRCLLVRAGGQWYGIPGAAVVECLNLKESSGVSRDGKTVPVLVLANLFSPSAPRQGAGQPELAGVIVRAGRRRACLAGDTHGGVRTVSVARAGGERRPWAAAAGVADDGSPVTVLDTARLVRRAWARDEGGGRQ
jgi:chemotaxis protein histidine kinase CheA